MIGGLDASYVLLKPSLWMARRRIKRILAKPYPAYLPPHRKWEKHLSPSQRQENFDYFMSIRKPRLEVFRSWIHEKFNVEATFDKRGIDSLSHWFDTHGGFFIDWRNLPNDYSPIKSYRDYIPPWNEPLLGVNILFDIGLWVGEYAITKFGRLRWDVDVGYGGFGEEKYGYGFGKPVVAGFRSDIIIRDPILFCVQSSFLLSLESFYPFKGGRRFGRHSLIRYFLQETAFSSDWDGYNHPGDVSNVRYW